MPTGATTGGAAIDGNASERSNKNMGKNGQEAPTIPFVRASFRHQQPFERPITHTLGATSFDSGVLEVPSYGFMRHIVLDVTCVGDNPATAADVAFTENGPWNVLQEVILSEPNGATILLLNDGYQLYLANKYGGYFGYNDPRDSLTVTTGTNAAGGSFSFQLRIPVEISARDALGALPNQNAASAFQVRFRLAPEATVFATAPSGSATVTIKAYYEGWAQPQSANPHGGVNMTSPPAMNTTQYWSVQNYTITQGHNRQRLNRVGNYLRNLVFLFERTSSTRANGDADFPAEDFTLWLDTTPIELNVVKTIWQRRLNERYGYTGTAETARARDLGVYPYDFCHEFDGTVGYELRDSWLLTNTSSRLEVEGTFANAGVLRVLTNDVTTSGNVFM